MMGADVEWRRTLGAIREDDHKLTLGLAVTLFLGLGLVVPIFSYGTQLLDLPVPYPQLVGTGGICVLFAGMCLALDRIRLGLSVALIVTGTFAANVPLSNYIGFLGEYGSYPGTLVWLMLFHAPLGLLVVHGLLFEDGWLFPLATEEKLLGAFVVWTAATGFFFTPGPRPDVAVLFALFVFQGIVIFGVMRRGIETGTIGYESAIGAFVVAVAGHALVGLLQMVRGASFGLERLGEPPVRETVDLFLFGLFDLHIGGWVSGFTGHPYVLAGYLVLILPIVLVYTVQSNRSMAEKIVLSGYLFGLTVALRATEGSALRGGFLVALVSLPLLYVVGPRLPTDSSRATVQLSVVLNGVMSLVEFARSEFTVRRFVLLSVIVLIILSPSSATIEGEQDIYQEPGSSGGPPVTNATSTPQQPTNATSTPQQPTNATPTPQQPTSTADRGGSGTGPLDEVQRLVDLRTLDIRVNQTVLGGRLATQYPIMGIGGQNFYYVSDDRGLRQKCLHNVYLGLFVETGIVGFGLFMLALFFVLRKLLALTERGNRSRFMSIGLLAGFIGYLSTEAFYCSLMQNANTMFMFYLIAGVTVGAYHARE